MRWTGTFVIALAVAPLAPSVALAEPGPEPGPSAPAPPPDAVVSTGLVGPGFVFRRPLECTPRRMRADRRILLDCAGEERVRVDPTSPAAVLEPLPPSTARVTVPSELAAVARYCPFEPVPALDAVPDRFIAYEDRDVGRCYLWAPLDRTALAASGKYDRADYLATIHPYMGAVILRAVAEASSAGHRFRVISGTRPGGRPSWHTFGLAVDVNLAPHKGLKEATRAYLDGGNERDAWLAFAATCERLGLYWLGHADPDEIFHFEWRPGWTGMPHGEVASGLAADLEQGGLAAVWARLRYDPTRPTALEALRDPLPVGATSPTP